MQIGWDTMREHIPNGSNSCREKERTNKQTKGDKKIQINPFLSATRRKGEEQEKEEVEEDEGERGKIKLAGGEGRELLRIYPIPTCHGAPLCEIARGGVYGRFVRRQADGPTNLEQPTLNHVQSDTMASAVLADTTRALLGTNRGSEPAMVESENDVGSLEQLMLYTDEHYLAGKLPLGDHLGKVLHGGRRISSA
ncbi:15-hydroxyprostaglandin dehydrogenase [Trichonephila clavipes]|nr:15-hydroxyprostaglandin dehydrogenase [Trichonephila clavipes]